MPSALQISVACIAVLAATACRRDARHQNPDTPPPPAVAPTPTTSSTTDPAEVFRRAFWRQPTSADRILNAERRVHPDGDSWQWFIQLHPSPELLAALRDPETFGLLSTPAPTLGPALPAAAPDWFPDLASPASLAPYEILKAPGGHLTVLHDRAADLLYATDHGSGFAPARR